MANHLLTPDQLEQRLLAFGIAVCRSLRDAKHDLVLQHITMQLIRCSTSPAANYAEARAAESRRDFIHKMQICLKELRETAVWLRFRAGIYGVESGSEELTRECQELMLIIGAGIRTARRSK
jgi:four helix bundle protein